jgi:FkbM family methyltransferase
MTRDLVFDVGMNNGDDTAYYLYKGFRVVAIEADPTLVEQARERFREAIRRGQLEIVNAAIGPRDEIAQFWICDQKSEWNSFDRKVASRRGLPHHAIPVQCRRFRDLLAQYTTPLYLKIDIEGHDHFCVDDLDAHDLPQYISLEMGPLENLFKLQDLGYKGFKLITQNNHTQLAVDLFSAKALIKRHLSPHPTMYRVGVRFAKAGRRVLRSLTPFNSSRPTGARCSGWQFSFGSSGPFGEDTDGSWQTLDDAAFTWVAYQLGRSHYGPPSLDVWHDVHATRVLA